MAVNRNPAMAPDAGPMREIHREAGYTIFSFEAPEDAGAFIIAARAVAPAGWPIAAGALPATGPA